LDRLTSCDGLPSSQAIDGEIFSWGRPMRARVLLAVAASIAALALGASAAQALPGIGLTPTVGPPGTLVVVEAGIPANSTPVTVSFDATVVGSGKTSPHGLFTSKFHVPASATPGVHTVTVEAMNGYSISALFTVRTNWNEARYELARGFDPYENVLSNANVGALGLIASASWEGRVRSEPIYTNGMVVTGSDDGTVRAFDPSSGEQLWSFDAGGQVLGSPTAVFAAGSSPQSADPCSIVADSSDGEIFGVDPATGARMWSYDGAGLISSQPVASGKEVIFAGDGGTLTALDGCTGTPLWSMGTAYSGPAQTPLAVPDVELPDGAIGTLIIGCFGDVTAAFDEATGGQVWSHTDPAPCDGSAAYGTLAKTRLVYAAGSEIVELNASNGEEVWSRPIAAPGLGGVAVNFKKTVTRKGVLKLSPLSLIVADEAGGVLALSAKNGKQLWSTAGAGTIEDASPAVANGVVYVAGDPGPLQDEGSLLALDVDTGAPLFSAGLGIPTPGSVGTPAPSVADGRVYVGGSGAGLRVFGLGAPAG
jgi:outer membrane protein assembly factor BamB